jgi:hypothetical protein
MATSEPEPGEASEGTANRVLRAAFAAGAVFGKAVALAAAAAFATTAGFAAGATFAAGGTFDETRRDRALAGTSDAPAGSMDDLLSGSSLMSSFSASASRQARAGRRRLLGPAYSEWPRER